MTLSIRNRAIRAFFQVLRDGLLISFVLGTTILARADLASAQTQAQAKAPTAAAAASSIVAAPKSPASAVETAPEAPISVFVADEATTPPIAPMPIDDAALAPEETLSRCQAEELWLRMSGDPHKSMALAGRRVVEVYRTLGKPEKAVEFLRFALDHNSSPQANLALRQMLAELLIETGRIEEGVQEYRTLMDYAKHLL